MTLEARNNVLKELKEKYMLYSSMIKRNRLDIEHHKYCTNETHEVCGAIWGHASIMQEIIARIWWWFTSEKPIFVSTSTKPKLQSIFEQINKQRKQEHWQENEIEDTEYYWLVEIIERCKGLTDLAKKRLIK